MHKFLDRPLAGEWPYLWLDATCLKVRQGGRIISVAAIISVAVNTDGGVVNAIDLPRIRVEQAGGGLGLAHGTDRVPSKGRGVQNRSEL